MGLFLTAVFSPALLSVTIPKIGSVYFVLSLFFLFLYYKSIQNKFKTDFAFKYVLIVTAVVYVVSACVAHDKHFYQLFIDLVQIMIIPICCSIAFEKAVNLDKFLHIISMLCYIVIGYTMLELLTDYNLYVSNCIGDDIFNGQLIEGSRFGLKRCQAFFSYHETLGAFCMINAAFCICLLYCKKINSEYNRHLIKLIILFSIGAFLSGSRSTILSLCIGFLPFLIARKKYILIVPILIVALYFFVPQYFTEIYQSFVDTESVEGSNSEMRSNQLELSIFYLMKSDNMFLGNGYAFADNVVVGKESGMAGAESIWFRVIMDQGVMGVIWLSFLFLYSIYRSYKISPIFICLPLAYFCQRTVAVVPTMTISYIFIFIMFLIKEKDFQEKTKTK